MHITFKNIILFIAVVMVLAGCGPSLEQKKEESGIHYRMGVVYLNDGNFTEALKELTVAIEAYPDEPSYHNALGLAYFAKGMNKEAREHMRDAIKLDPKLSEAHVNLAAIYLVEENWDGAISESRLALENIFYRTPELAHFNMGQAYFNKGEYKEALASFSKAVELNPRYALAYYNMGLTLDRMNSPRDSIRAYENAVKASPGYLDAYYGLGLAHIKVKDNSSAMKAFRKVIEIAPESEQARSAKEYMDLLR
jgi:tetratricopeptide (TPR) repeat protein